VLLEIELGGHRYEFRPEDSPWRSAHASSRVPLSHPLVSRNHGRFTWGNGSWAYEDTSRHGTSSALSAARHRICAARRQPLPNAASSTSQATAGRSSSAA